MGDPVANTFLHIPQLDLPAVITTFILSIKMESLSCLNFFGTFSYLNTTQFENKMPVIKVSLSSKAMNPLLKEVEVLVWKQT